MSLPNSDISTNSKQASYGKYLVCFFLLLAGAALAFWNAFDAQATKASLQSDLTNLRIYSQELATLSAEAVQGNEAAFTALQLSQDNFKEGWVSAKGELNSEDPEVRSSQNSVEKLWVGISSSTDAIIERKDSILKFYQEAEKIDAILPRVQQEYSTVVSDLVIAKSEGEQIVLAQEQVLVAERISRHLTRMLNATDDASKASDEFNRDVRSFNQVLAAMITGDKDLKIKPIKQLATFEKLSDISTTFRKIFDNLSATVGYSNDLVMGQQAADAVLTQTNKLLKSFELLGSKAKSSVNTLLPIVVGCVLAGFAIFTLFLMLNRTNLQTRQLLEAEARIRAEEEQANQRNQKAILLLLDELGDLGDGDLTVQTTVTEDFTGAIADSINFTIDQLRSLVFTINETALKVTGAAHETQHTAKHLAEASDHQAQEIAGASAAVNQIAISIDQVSANASESSQVAERSVMIANKGADVVQATINGMDTIREQIQDTSKRIKRLGESSQEIGDIVSLINDIADQTNILALNAAIQASMAGDAGRGFAVVADEVQRLAERASAATKQIEALVKAIQNDTNEAVISMEQTTAQVVNGARLAHDAGVALGEIETVSKNLADLIQNISNAARQQAASAGQISKTMNVIQEITSQTSTGTTATASSIGHLADLAVQMRNSVAGFKLPDQHVA